MDSAGTQGNSDSFIPSISADGRYVAFASGANNLVPDDTNGTDIFVHDRVTGATERVSVESVGTQGNESSDGYASISADGRYVAFASRASNLVAGDTNSAFDVFVRDRGASTPPASTLTATVTSTATTTPTPTATACPACSPTPTFTPVTPPAVGGIAEQPDVTALPSAAPSGHNYAGYIVGAAVAFGVAAAGAAGWRKQRKRV